MIAMVTAIQDTAAELTVEPGICRPALLCTPMMHAAASHVFRLMPCSTYPVFSLRAGLNRFQHCALSLVYRPQLSQSFRRIRTNRIIGVHFGRPNHALLVDHVPCWDWQAVFGLVVEPVQGATERLVKLAQVIRQCEDKPKLLGSLQMKIS